MSATRRTRTMSVAIVTGLLALFGSTLGAFAVPAAAASDAGPTRSTDAAASVSDAVAAAAALADDPPSAHEVFTSGDITIDAYYCDADKPTQTYTVPDGVTSVYLEAVGGQGQTPNPDSTGLGGLGGQVTGGLTVAPKQEFSVQVGCVGDDDGGASAYAKGGERGTGWAHLNDALTVYSYGYDGGGGGGASAVLSGSEPVAVAGGGGGAAGSAGDCFESDGTGDFFFYYCGGNAVEQGGNGGDGGGDDTTGSVGVNNPGPPTADGSTCGAGIVGSKGSNFDLLGAGGAGGGGGGGYGGGCGGAAGPAAVIDPGHVGTVHGNAGNGGGGGQSYAGGMLNKSAITVADDAGDGYVLFLTSADGVRTTHFGFSERPETYCVPDGVDEIFVDALGGAGAGGGSEFRQVGTGGSGSGVQAVVPVTERTQLQITVGQFGWAHGGYGDGRGGDRGTASDATADDGAGGGGSTAVKQSTTPCGDSPLTDLEYLVVAGGGGGGGGDGISADGGDGGDAGNPGQPGEQGGDPNGGDFGCGGVAPGQGGCNDGPHGGNGTGDNTGGGGGGGGGGYYGGGKGHAPQSGEDGGGGGGGGGASYVTPRSPQAVHYYLGAPGDYGNRDGLNDGKVDLIVPIPTHRSEIQIVSGNKQSLNPGQRLGEAVVLQYVDALDNGNVEGIPIDLTFLSRSGQPATFLSGGATERVVTDEAGRASFDLTSLESRVPGQFAVQASVADDPAHLIKSSQVTFYNTQFTTEVAVTSSTDDNTSTDGEPVTFTAALTTPENGGGPVDSGTVQFTVDGTPLGGPVNVQSGFAQSEAISTLVPGPHHVLATYTDVEEGAQAPSFASLGQTVAADAATSVSIESSNPAAVDGESARFTASVTAQADLGMPTGTVQFALNGANLGAPVPLDGEATAASASTVLNIPTGSTGGKQPFEVTAIYSGDPDYVASTGTLTQYVKWDTTLDIWSSAPEGVYSDTSVTFTGTVEGTWYPDFYPKHTGTLQAFLGDQPLTDPFPIDDKSGTTPPVEASTLGIGIHEITLRYSGDANYGPATSDTFYQIVLDLADRPPGETPPPSAPPVPPGSNPTTGGSHSGLAMSGTDAAGVMLAAGILLTVGGLLFGAVAVRRRRRGRGVG